MGRFRDFVARKLPVTKVRIGSGVRVRGRRRRHGLHAAMLMPKGIRILRATQRSVRRPQPVD
jgi:predicted metal-dependent hydrolase